MDTANHRSGEIEFRLPREGTTGYGSITFTTMPPTAICPELTESRPASGEPVRTVLRISRLAVNRGSIGGWLAPYRDAERQCWVDTWFVGRLIRDRLKGTFFVHPTATEPPGGRLVGSAVGLIDKWPDWSKSVEELAKMSGPVASRICAR